jgi:hypothetical protein
MDKPRWTQVTDDVGAALIQGGKYRDHLPTFVRLDSSVWVRVDAAWKAWRAQYFGNNRCQK